MRTHRPWVDPDPAHEAAAERLMLQLALPRTLARVLCARGIDDPEQAERFLEPRLDHLLDPRTMAEMPAAAARLARALGAQEHVVVNGDYDADGVSGTALLVSELRARGGKVDFFIPDRERDGYGITPRLVQRAGEVGVRVLVSVDCGSSDHQAIAQARECGIDVVVVDHHEIDARPAGAFAVLNPKRDDCPYPFKGLSAVGVAHKLVHALALLRGEDPPAAALEFVALGTLADSQPMSGENRTLVGLGLRSLGRSTRPGLRALRETAGVGASPGSRDVGYRLVPRLNAAGRMARGKLAVDLLLAPDGPSAARLASEVEARNRARQGIDQEVTREALERGAALVRARDVAALVLASETWHPGVVGIAAARLVQRYGVPAAVVGFANGVGRGSVRTTRGIDVKAALDQAGDLLVRHGGHREAAGFTIEARHLPEFALRFEAAVRAGATGAPEEALVADAEIELGEATPALVGELARLEPYGVGHREPLFLLRGLTAGPRTRTVGERHLKLDLESGGERRDGIAFGHAEHIRPADVLGRRIDVLAQVRRQDPRWGEGAELVVVDLRASPDGVPSRGDRP